MAGNWLLHWAGIEHHNAVRIDTNACCWNQRRDHDQDRIGIYVKYGNPHWDRSDPG